MRPSTVIRAVIVLAALGPGLAWATAATAIGVVAGLVLGLGLGGWLVRAAGRLVRGVVRPGRSNREPLLPGRVATGWLALLAAACVVVAERVHSGAAGDPHGADFVPLALPFLLFTLSAVRIADHRGRASGIDRDDVVVAGAAGAADGLFDA